MMLPGDFLICARAVRAQGKKCPVGSVAYDKRLRSSTAKSPSRTAKSCGSDASTPASSPAEVKSARPSLDKTISADAPRGRKRVGRVPRHCERSEAIHLTAQRMDCFAALAMTVSNQRRSRRLLPSPRRLSRRGFDLLRLFPPSQNLRRQHRAIEPLQVQLFE